ncbi:MAG: error-prone DNA polymerase [Gammaproteobacteria bacterium]|nr:error-prone DNA polymerase [Pseudomonadales bacterium]MCP5348124.1 error-prone DNA polymerase [Pseudomonadales bacterium]
MQPSRPASRQAPVPGYAELHCLSNYTFLRGASFPEELVETAMELGYRALAITDECTLSGVVRAHVAAREAGLKLIIGSEFSVAGGQDSTREQGFRLVLLATSRAGYGALSHLISRARREAVKGEYRLDRELLEANLPGECLALWVPDLRQPEEVVVSQLVWLKRLLNGRLWIAVELLLRGNDRRQLRYLETLGGQFAVPLCAAGGVLMHSRQRRILQDTVTAIRLGRPIGELGFAAEPNGERYLRNRDQLVKLYPARLLEETLKIAERCQFSLDELRYEYPRELVPEGYTPHGWLRELTEQGIRRRWPGGASPKVRNIIEHELTLVRELGYEHYFLTVHDLVQFARRQQILCQGRGSAANSAVCYCLGITEVDPDRVAVLFERFISRERDEPPDIDVDFENARREEVIQYIYNKYGRHRAALAATVITYRSRSAIREVGKVLGLDRELLDHISRSIYWWGSDLEEQLSDADIDYSDPRIRQLVYLARSLIGFPRHLSQHVGGFVISQGPLSQLVPVENAAMADRTVIQWEKDDLEALGLLKIDVLALGMLTAVQKCLKLVSSYSPAELTVQKVPAEDPRVYDMMGEADTVGVFQIESRAQMSMLPRLKPRNYYDLVIQIAIVRPGPIQGDMVHPYLARRSGSEKVSYPSDEVKVVLERTLGVPIFQEQVMQLAMVAAGFSGGEADQLRRAMAAWKRKGGLEQYRDKLINGMLARGYEHRFAERLFRQIQGFGDYGFPESHSASFALIAYVSSWLKCYHPAAFCCALLNSQPMGFYAPAQLLQDAVRHGVKVLPVDVNHSFQDCMLEFAKCLDESLPGRGSGSGQGAGRSASPDNSTVCSPESGSLIAGAERSSVDGKPDEATAVDFTVNPGPMLRIGFNQVKGLSEAGARAIVEARENSLAVPGRSAGSEPGADSASAGGRAFRSIQELVFRSGINSKDLESLAAADALRGLSGDRHRAFWYAAGAVTEESWSRWGESGYLELHSDNESGIDLMLPPATESQNIMADYAALGFTLRRHPLSLLRSHLDSYQVSPAEALSEFREENLVKVAGIVTCRQRPMTASGVTFITMEDETGTVNVVVWPTLGERRRPVVRQAKLLGVAGHVQHSEGVTHLIARELVDLTHWLGTMQLSSRDFT